MKVSVYLSLFVMLVLLFSCSENRDARALFERVDSLMDEDPKLVLMMLDSASDASIDYPRRQKMRYELLRAKAMNKAYVDFTTDSIMKEVVEYYDNHGTANEKVEAHYLLGCVYRDLHESPAALSCYYDAVECADTLSGDFDNKLLMRVHAQMADLFDNQIMPYQELEELYLYEHYALAASDTFSYIIGKELESRAYNLMNDKDMEVKALLEANRLFKSKGYKADAAQAIVSIIPVYIERGDTANAASVIRYFENESGLIDENGDVSDNFWHYYNSKGLYFESINNLDSAEFFYRKLCKRGFNYDAYKGLLSIFSKKEMADSVFLYSSLKENAFDLQYTNLHTQAMFNANGMYNYARNQRIALEKEKEALNYSNNILYICVISGVIMLLSLYLFIKYKRNKKKEYNLLVSRYHTNREEYHKAVDDYRQMEENFEDYKKKQGRRNKSSAR